MEINCYDCIYCKLYKEEYMCVRSLRKIINQNNIPCKYFILKGGC